MSNAGVIFPGLDAQEIIRRLLEMLRLHRPLQDQDACIGSEIDLAITLLHRPAEKRADLGDQVIKRSRQVFVVIVGDHVFLVPIRMGRRQLAQEWLMRNSGIVSRSV